MSASLLLTNPKYPHNVGAAVRAASSFGADRVWFTGDRVSLTGGRKSARLPREERMRAYRDVELLHLTDPVGPYHRLEHHVAYRDLGIVPVAVELTPTAEQLPDFEHPENVLYVFGPEDGGLSKVDRMHCHRHVLIPTRHCLNLGAAVNVVLYDRAVKRRELGLEPIVPSAQVLDEDRWLMDELGLMS